MVTALTTDENVMDTMTVGTELTRGAVVSNYLVTFLVKMLVHSTMSNIWANLIRINWWISPCSCRRNPASHATMLAWLHGWLDLFYKSRD